jgi:uncharacterized phage infection (PIP) family protein YhgE
VRQFLKTWFLAIMLSTLTVIAIKVIYGVLDWNLTTWHVLMFVILLHNGAFIRGELRK